MNQFNLPPKEDIIPIQTIEGNSLQEAAKVFGGKFASNIHAVFEDVVKQYNREHPGDIHMIDSVEEFTPEIDVSDDRIEFHSKSIKLVLIKNGTKWEVGELKQGTMTAPGEVEIKIKDELRRTKDSFAQEFNNVLEQGK